jgi:hypothetical protein
LWFQYCIQILAIKDLIRPPRRDDFKDVYIVTELMDTDLHQIIRSNQSLTDDHCQVCCLLLVLLYSMKIVLVETSFVVASLDLSIYTCFLVHNYVLYLLVLTLVLSVLSSTIISYMFCVAVLLVSVATRSKIRALSKCFAP